MRSLRYLNSILTVLAVLLALQLWTTWTTSPVTGMASTAEAAKTGIPDAGGQRKQMIDLLKTLSQQSADLNSMFSSGSARVTLQAGGDE